MGATGISWPEIDKALTHAEREADALAQSDADRAKRRFGLVVARQELQKLFEEGDRQ